MTTRAKRLTDDGGRHPWSARQKRGAVLNEKESARAGGSGEVAAGHKRIDRSTTETADETQAITPKQKLRLANTFLRDTNLTPAARIVGWYITDYVNTQRGYAWTPQEQIARDLGIGMSSVHRSIKQLAKYFVINRERRQHEYHPTPVKMTGID